MLILIFIIIFCLFIFNKLFKNKIIIISNLTMDYKSESGNLNCSLFSNENETAALNSSCHMCLRHKRKKDTYNPIPKSVKDNLQKGLNNGRWTLEEHTNFIKGVINYGNKWKKIEQLVVTRNCLQARSHSQKIFSKLELLQILPKELCSIKALYNHCLALSSEELAKMIYLLTVIVYERLEKDNLKKEAIDSSTKALFESKEFKNCCQGLDEHIPSNKISVIKIPITVFNNQESSLSKLIFNYFYRF